MDGGGEIERYSMGDGIREVLDERMGVLMISRRFYFCFLLRIRKLGYPTKTERREVTRET